MSALTGATLVVADLDGTLTFTAGAPEPQILAAWDALLDTRGVRVALATARSPRCVRRWFGDRTGRIDLVCCNGALVIPTQGSVSWEPLPVPALHRVLTRLAADRAGYCLEYGDHFVASSPTALPWMGDHHRRVLAPGEGHRTEGVVKVSVDSGRAAHRAATDLRGVQVLAHATGDADIVRAGVGKEVAVASLRRPGERLVALGNDENDRGLLWAADRAYLVGTGLRDLDAAPHVRRVTAAPWAVTAVLRDLTAPSGRLTSAR